MKGYHAILQWRLKVTLSLLSAAGSYCHCHDRNHFAFSFYDSYLLIIVSFLSACNLLARSLPGWLHLVPLFLVLLYLVSTSDFTFIIQLFLLVFYFLDIYLLYPTPRLQASWKKFLSRSLSHQCLEEYWVQSKWSVYFLFND